MAGNPPFPLGIFVGNPNANSPSQNATFETNFQTFETTLGETPTFMDGFTDFSQDPSQWRSNADFTAYSWAKTGSNYVGPGSGITPVIGVPLASNAGGYSNVDTFFKSIVAGTYDADYQGIVDAWSGKDYNGPGYNTVQLRIGYEFNGNFMPWGPGNSNSPTVNADFIAAWQHVATIMRAQAAVNGITVQTVWNPADINYNNTFPESLYPGNDYVDIISTDAYSPTYPLDLTNWATSNSAQAANGTAWAAIAANREHYWEYSDGTQYFPTGHDNGWNMADVIAFAKAQGKPLSISETGAGNKSAGPQGPVDDADFPKWLSGALTQAEASGVNIQNVNVWATDQSDGSWGFLNGEKPGEAAAWNEYFGADSVSEACFLRGTCITTPSGEVSVEHLAVGDSVLSHYGVKRRIVWIGEGCVLATRGHRNAATPVVVRKGALADNVPYQDLHITMAHSLYVDGVLIPVEFLINHRSILWDDFAKEVTFYHIELETHDVILANGAPAESYRDDGNRWLFHNANSGWSLPPQKACAQVVTGGSTVDQAWRRILERSGPRPGFTLTKDPNLHLLVDECRIDATSQHGEQLTFWIPKLPSSVRIVSRDAVPAELGLSRDSRSLGVALRRVELRKGAELVLVEAEDDRLVNGFHGYEPQECLRWTNGNAELPVELFAKFKEGTELVLQLAGTTFYPCGQAEKPLAA